MTNPLRVLVGGVEVPGAALNLEPAPDVPVYAREFFAGPERWEGTLRAPWAPWARWPGFAPGARVLVENAFADFGLAGHVVRREPDRVNHDAPLTASYRVVLNEYVARVPS